MPKKKNFLGGQQNYNPNNGQYEPALKGPNGESPSQFSSFKKAESEDKNESFDAINKKRMGKEEKSDIKFNPNDDHYKLKSPEITNTDAYLTAPIVSALEKAEGRSLENDELRKIVKDMAKKNPNATPEEFEKMLLNYKGGSSEEQEGALKMLKWGGNFTDDEWEKVKANENWVKGYLEGKYTPKEIKNALKAESEYNSFDQINAKRMGKEQPKSEETTKSYKSADRKDKYGNPLVSDDAFKVGQKAAKEYLDQLNESEGFDAAKDSFVTLGGFRDAISDALEQAGLNPDYDLTYQDLNEIIGSVTGEEIDFEDYEGNGKGWTGKKYSGYDPNNIYKAKNNAIKEGEKGSSWRDNREPLYTQDEWEKHNSYLEKGMHPDAAVEQISRQTGMKKGRDAETRQKLEKSGFELDNSYTGGNTYKIMDKSTGRTNSITLTDEGYYSAMINGQRYDYPDLDTAIDRATYKSGKAPSNGAIGWENDSYDRARAEKKLKELRGY